MAKGVKDADLKRRNVSADNVETVTSYNAIPFALLNEELAGMTNDTIAEFTKITELYRVYKAGKEFVTEGSNGDYVPANLKYKLSANLINKEARFLFAESPDIIVDPKGDLGKITKESKDNILVYNDLVKTILDKNNFEEKLIKAAKDCFIGKRVAGLLNWNEEDGVTLVFLPSRQFIYETKIDNEDVITKFVAFIIIKDSIQQNEKRIFKKKFWMDEDNVVHLSESIYDGAGTLIDTPTEDALLDIDFIPVRIFINDGLTGEGKGESEVEQLQDFEEYYSKLSNGDVDAERKSMNPIRYSVDMDNRSTKDLSSSAGSFWDLQTDQNLTNGKPEVGTLESSMEYSEALEKTLARIKMSGYEQVDVPDINLETMKGTITSGKALKALYWPLIIRCKEKMKMWGPQLQGLIDMMIKGSMVYPDCVRDYVNNELAPIAYEIRIVQNLPLPEDEQEEKNIDLAEIENKTMSRKTYMKKWYGLTDKEVDEELNQIAKERQIIDDSSFSGVVGEIDYTEVQGGDDE